MYPKSMKIIIGQSGAYIGFYMSKTIIVGIQNHLWDSENTLRLILRWYIALRIKFSTRKIDFEVTKNTENYVIFWKIYKNVLQTFKMFCWAKWRLQSLMCVQIHCFRCSRYLRVFENNLVRFLRLYMVLQKEVWRWKVTFEREFS